MPERINQQPGRIVWGTPNEWRDDLPYCQSPLLLFNDGDDNHLDHGHHDRLPMSLPLCDIHGPPPITTSAHPFA